MFKRYQVLLDDWQEEYIIFLSKKYDISFSECIRGVICLQALGAVLEYYPEYKAKYTVKDIKDNMEKYASTDREKFHRFLSDAFFESRKAIEYRLSKEKETEEKKASHKRSGK